MNQFQDSQISELNIIPIPDGFETTSKAQVALKSKASVLVCQRPKCLKHGGSEVCQALKSALSALGLEDRVSIRETGCMKRCKTGPNIIFMPDRAYYGDISPEDILELVEKYFDPISSLVVTDFVDDQTSYNQFAGTTRI